MRTKHGFLTISDQRLPLVDVVYAPLANDAWIREDYREAFEEYARLASRGVPLAYLIDMRTFDPLRVDASVRQYAAETFKQYRSKLLPVSVAEARVLTNALTRGIVTAFDWLTGANKWPCRQFASLDEGERWLRAQLASGPRVRA